MEKEIRIVLIEDDNKYRTELCQTIGNKAGLRMLAAYENRDSALNFIAYGNPDVVLLDIKLTGLDGVKTAAAVKALSHDTLIIMLTNYADEESVFGSLKNGANGYILKSDGAAKLLKAIDDVMHGCSAMSMTIAHKVKDHFNNLAPDVRLTKHQYDILLELCQGKSNHAIAEDNNIEVSTVRYHIHNIFLALHASNRVEVLFKALKKGIIDLFDLD